MNDTLISFIVPLRNREQQVPGLIFNLSKFYKNCEIILANQGDNTLFKHGQLRNLGYKKSKGDIVVFIDVDVRLLEFIDFVELQNVHNQSMLMFGTCYEAIEKHSGNFEVQRKRVCTHCKGRLLCFTRSQFENCGGYSNLCAGWSWEDDLLYRRAKPKKISYGQIAHVSHPYQRNEMKCVDHNRMICNTDGGRDSDLDGYKQTISQESSPHMYSNVSRYNFFNICVDKNYVYSDLYKDVK